MKTDDRIEEATSLPMKEGARRAGRVLQNLNATDAEIDAVWMTIAHPRLEAARSGLVQAGTLCALEQALTDLSVASQDPMPVVVQHVARSFDPCMVCTVYEGGNCMDQAG